MTQHTHVSPFAGSWYPDQVPELQRLLDRLVAESATRAGSEPWPDPLGLIVPHAGLVYSGTVAAAALRHLAAARPERVFLLGFSHRGAAHGIHLPDIEALQTPLGRTLIDREAWRRLAAAPGFRVVDEASVCDHSIEIQLPLLRHLLPSTPVVPLYVGPLSPAERASAARALVEVRLPGDVFVASSDLTHYGRAFHYLPFAVDSLTESSLHDLDEEIIEAAGSVDSALFLDAVRRLKATACGVDPIALLLEVLSLLGDDIYQETLDYDTSGRITGDFSHSVSYGALGFFHADSFRLGLADQRALLASARATFEQTRTSGERRGVPPDPLTPALQRRAALFVSLHQGERLLGCIGTRAATEPLARAVPQMTLAAALEDPRMAPATHARGRVDIEISVLTPMRRVCTTAAFRVGRHGACLERGLRAGLLLPQVADNRFYTAAEFLDALCQKAGLPKGTEKNPAARLRLFEAQVFSEASLGLPDAEK